MISSFSMSIAIPPKKKFPVTDLSKRENLICKSVKKVKGLKLIERRCPSELAVLILKQVLTI